MGSHSVGAFRSTNSTCRVHIPLMVCVLAVISCIVPATITGIVVTAINFLLDDHVPNSMKSCVVGAASSARLTFLEDTSAVSSSLMLASLVSALTGWDLSNSSTSTAQYGGCGTLAALQPSMVQAGFCDSTESWKNATTITRVLNRFVPWNASSSGGAAINAASVVDRALGSLLLSSGVPSPFVTVAVSWVARASPSMLHIVQLSRLNSSTGTWQESASNNDTSRLLLARSDTTTKYVTYIDPVDASTTSWFPASEPALRQRNAILGDGLYVEVTQLVTIDGDGGGNSSTSNHVDASLAAAATRRGVRSSAGWAEVFFETAISIHRLSTSSASSTTATVEAALQPTAIAVYHVGQKLLTACAELDTTAASTTVLTPKVLSATIDLGRGSPALNDQLLDDLPGCASLVTFLGGTDVGSFVDAQSQASSTNYVVWTSFGGTSTWALNASTTTLSPDDMARRVGLSPAQRAADGFIVLVVVPQGQTEANIIRTRGAIGVVAFVVAAVTVTLLVATTRLISQPLPALTKAINACATLQLHKIEMMEASVITEIADIQRALNYLSIRLHHYLKYLPDRRIIEYVSGLNSSDEDDEDTDSDHSSNSDEDVGDEDNAAADGPSAALLAAPFLSKKHSSVRLTKSRGGDDEDAAEFALEEKLIEQRRMKHPKAPLHSVLVNVIYESRHLNRNTMERWKVPNKSAEFVFKHRVSDPVLNMLTRQCREQLRERPGEVLLLFSGKKDGSDYGMRQLVTDEDVLFALEQCKASNSISQLGASFSSVPGGNSSGGSNSVKGGGSSQSTTGPQQLPVLTLCIRKGSVKTVLPVLIALGTLFTVVSRFILSVQRLSADATEQLLGLTLLGCLGVQVAQNALISLYLVRRFRILDRDFKAWAEVSPKEIMVGVACGSLNVTNLEVMSCHVRLSQGLRLSAPVSPRLRMKISMYSFVGFIVGDLLPFVFILIYTVLTGQYRDPYALISVIFSVLSVASILVSHGIMRFVLAGRTAPGSNSVSGGAGSGGSSPSMGRSLLLSRREITVLHIRVTAAESLIDTLSISLADKLIEQLYETVQKIAKKSGGLLIEAQGLSLVMAWNSHSVVPNHSLVAYRAFQKIREEVERNVLTPFFASDKMRANIAKQLPSAQRGQTHLVTHAVRAVHHRHRLVGSLLTGDMAMGYVGTLTSQSFQRVGAYGVLCDALCRLNELYGSTLLTNKLTLDAIQQSAAHGQRRAAEAHGFLLTRKLDDIVLSSELSTMNAALTPYLDPSSVAGATVTIQQTKRSTVETLWKKAKQSLAVVAPDAEVIPVYELVVHAFVNPNLLDASHHHGGGSPTSGVGAAEGSGLSPIFQHRLKPRGSRTSDAVHQFLDALDVLRTFQNATPMDRYLELHPDDVVAARVFVWARFLEAPNRDVAIHYPRTLSSLGVSRHPCETPEGAHLHPSHEITDTERALTAMQQRADERNLRLRPPRSVRRAKELAARTAAGTAGSEVHGGSGLGLGGTSGQVVEQVLGAQGDYSIRFHQGRVVDIPFPAESLAPPTSAATKLQHNDHRLL